MKNLLNIFIFFVAANITFANNTTPENNSTVSKNVATSHDVFFNTDEHSLTTEEFQKLLGFIKATENVDIERMSIYGYCDDRGSVSYNQKLSNKRANAIRDIIAKYRNTNKKPQVISKGNGEVALTTQEKALFNELRSLNRRVTIAIAPKKLIAGAFFGEDLKTGSLINLKNLKFKLGYRYLTPESMKTLKELADFLVKRSDIFFTINGHVCCTKNGQESRDRETGKRNLSEVRAKFIRDYLVKAGVDSRRVRYQGLAGKYNLGGDAKEDRRVELLIRYIAK